MVTVSRLLQSNRINLIRKHGGLVAGDKATYDLWLCGSVLTVTKEKDVKAIDKAISEAKRNGYCVKEYLQYVIVHEGILD